jgi:hypothetical protein
LLFGVNQVHLAMPKDTGGTAVFDFEKPKQNMLGAEVVVS